MLAGVKRGPIHYDYAAPEGQTRVSNWIGWRCNLIKMSGITAHHSSTDTSLPGCWNHVWHPKSCALNIKNIVEGIPYLHKKKVQMQLCSVFYAWPEYKLHMLESVGFSCACMTMRTTQRPPRCRLWLEPDLSGFLCILSGGWHPT